MSTETQVDEATRVKGYEIVVNGTPDTVQEQRVTFEQVVKIAFPAASDPNVTYSVTYRKAHQDRSGGTLVAGGSVEVKKKGTSFNVVATTRS
jgi:hypothetical protein